MPQPQRIVVYKKKPTIIKIQPKSAKPLTNTFAKEAQAKKATQRVVEVITVPPAEKEPRYIRMKRQLIELAKNHGFNVEHIGDALASLRVNIRSPENTTWLQQYFESYAAATKPAEYFTNGKLNRLGENFVNTQVRSYQERIENAIREAKE